jgi:hypothetical protein
MGEQAGVALVDADVAPRAPTRPRAGARAVPLDLIALVVIELTATCWVLARGQLLNIDTMNSHVYVLWSLSHRQQDFAWAPGGPGSYLPATWNLPWWLLAEHAPPWCAGLFLALLHGLTIWLVWLLARRLCARGASRHHVLVPVLSTVVAFTSAMFLMELGTTFGDIATAPLLVGSLVVLAGPPSTAAVRRWLIAGALTGAAFGLKLTNGPYLLAVLASCGWWTLPGRRLRATAWTAAGAVSGALVAGGWWWVKMAARFGNPAFPFFGGILHSSYGRGDDFADARWHLSPLDAMALPWRMATDSYPVETTYRDGRWLLLLVALGLMLVFGRRTGGRTLHRLAPLLGYLGAATLIWVLAFGYGRYLLVADLVLAPVLVVLVVELAGGRRLRLALAGGAVVALLLAALELSPNPAVGWDRSWLHVAVPPVLQQADLLVVLPGNDGLSFVVASLPDDVQMVQAPSVFGVAAGQPAMNGSRAGGREDVEVAALVRAHRGPVVALVDGDDVGAGQRAATVFGRRQADVTSCQQLQVYVMHVAADRIVMRVAAGAGAPAATMAPHTALACPWR